MNDACDTKRNCSRKLDIRHALDGNKNLKLLIKEITAKSPFASVATIPCVRRIEYYTRFKKNDLTFFYNLYFI